MLYAVKGNKQLKIDEAEKETYLKLGYDIAQVSGNELKTVETSPSKTVPYAEYKKLLDEYEEFKAAGGNLDEINDLNVRYGAAQTEIKALKEKLAEANKKLKDAAKE